MFESMNSKFTEDISDIDNRVAEINLQTATFQQLLDLPKSMLADIPAAWFRQLLIKNKEFQLFYSQRACSTTLKKEFRTRNTIVASTS
jgi:hypothetical protein